MKAREIIAIGVGVATAAGSWFALKRLGPPPVQTVSVVAAKREISPYVPLTPDDLGFRTVPVQGLDERAVRDPREAVGRVALAPVLAGEILLRDKLGSADAVLGPGFRAVAVKTDLVLSAGGQVRPGDLVDVHWVPREARTPGGRVAENVPVLDVRTGDNRPYRPESGGSRIGITVAGEAVTAGTVTTPGLVILKLRPDQVQPVVLAAERGTIVLARLAPGTKPENAGTGTLDIGEIAGVAPAQQTEGGAAGGGNQAGAAGTGAGNNSPAPAGSGASRP